MKATTQRLVIAVFTAAATVGVVTASQAQIQTVVSSTISAFTTKASVVGGIKPSPTFVNWDPALVNRLVSGHNTNRTIDSEQVGSDTAPAPDDLLERVEQTAVVQLYTDGFESLSLDEKRLVYHLTQAAIAGRDIFYDQKFAPALEMREVVEAILRHPDAVPPATLAELQRYAKLFWISNGPHDLGASKKFVLNVGPAELASAARAAASAGATFPTATGETLDDLLRRLAPFFFDPTVAEFATTTSAPDGHDMLTASANNLYVGVSQKDLEGFVEQYTYNSRLVKRDGALVEEVYRIDGRYAPQIRAIVGHLEEARAVAPPRTARALDALIQWYRTGSAADRRAYDIAWVEDSAARVDSANSFTEVYLDPRGVKGSWQGFVWYVDEKRTGDIRTLAREAQWFEDRMPWDPRYRKHGVQGIVANAIQAVAGTGDIAPWLPSGVNLPNDEAVREQHGSKSVSLANVADAYNRSEAPGFRTEFAWTPEEAERAGRWAHVADDLHTNMHEVIGHASGRVADRLQGRPEEALREYYSSLEETRAELVGLYFLADPKVVDLGLVSAADHRNVVLAGYEHFTRLALQQLRRAREGTSLDDDHMRPRQAIVHWLMANTTAVEKRTRDGKTFYVMVDAEAYRAGIGRLLADVQRIKAEGDHAAAKALFDTYGRDFDPALRDEVVRRADAAGVPSYTVFVMPKLEAVRASDGSIADVRISYPRDLTTQMLEYADQTRATRKAFLAAEHGSAAVLPRIR